MTVVKCCLLVVLGSAMFWGCAADVSEDEENRSVSSMLKNGNGNNPAPGLSAVSPNLGDTLGAVRITLTGSNFNGTAKVTIGGTACANVAMVNRTTITCQTPAKPAGRYDVTMTTNGGTTTLARGYESWSPLVDYADARVFQADTGVTASSAAMRYRSGELVRDFGHSPRDGAAIVRLPSGRLLMLGGWYPKQFADGLGGAIDTTNEVLASDDDGVTWSTLLAHDPQPVASGPGARFAPGHNTGVVRHASGGTEYVYWIGADANAAPRNGEVWRSTNGKTWTLVSSTAPTADRSLFGAVSFGGDLYVLGGQRDMSDPTSAVSQVFRSSDGGVTWTQLEDAPWAGRTAFEPVVFGDKLFVVGGATYSGAQDIRTYYNDVWSFDGTTWREVLPNGHTQWTGRHYHQTLVWRGRLWLLGGFARETLGLGEADAYSSPDGVTWTAASNVGWPGMHSHAAWVAADDSAIAVTTGIADASIWKLIEHSGTLVSGLRNRGPAALSLTQSSAAQQPLLDPSAFPDGAPGLVFWNGQELNLPAPDRDVSGGVFETWVVLRSFNQDTTSETPGNPPCPLVGYKSLEAYNQMGLSGTQVRYSDWSRGVRSSIGGTVSDDRPRLIGASHRWGSAKVFVGTTQVSENPTVLFENTYTGWDSLGVGYAGLDYAKNVVIGAVVVLKTDVETGDAFRARLSTWAGKWGATP